MPRTVESRIKQLDRTQKLKALGNAIVPQVAYVILAEIAAIERSAE